MTLRKSALRTIIRNALVFHVNDFGGASIPADSGSGWLSRSHSSIRLESTCLTSSPSHSMRSVSSSVFASSGTVCRSAL